MRAEGSAKIALKAPSSSPAPPAPHVAAIGGEGLGLPPRSPSSLCFPLLPPFSDYPAASPPLLAHVATTPPFSRSPPIPLLLNPKGEGLGLPPRSPSSLRFPLLPPFSDCPAASPPLLARVATTPPFSRSPPFLSYLTLKVRWQKAAALWLVLIVGSASSVGTGGRGTAVHEPSRAGVRRVWRRRRQELSGLVAAGT